MRVAFLVDKFPKTSETFIINQVVGLLERGHDVRIFSSQRAGGDIHDLVDEYNLMEKTTYTGSPDNYLEALKILSRSLFTIGLRKPSYLFPALKTLKQGKQAPEALLNLQTFIEEESFDIAHAHFGPVGNRWLTAINSTDSSFLVSFYGYDISKVPSRNPSVYSNLFSSIDKAIAITDDMEQELVNLGCEKSKIEKVPLGIDLSEFQFKPREKSPDEPYKLLTIGRFVEKKGITYGLEAVSRLKASYDIEYNLVGDGKLREEIEKKIQEEDLEQEVNLHGYVDYSRLRELMHENHILVAPSVTARDGDKEGAPMVIIEAQATGMPVVSTRHAGIPEIVGEGAHLAEEGNSIDLASKLEVVLKGCDNWVETGKWGKWLVEEAHTKDEMIDCLESIYSHLVC